MSWNSIGLNASIQTTTLEPSQAMHANSSIHQVVVDTGKERVFVPNRLKASVGDTVLFTPVSLGDRIFRIASDHSCQANDSLSAINFSRLMFPYLVTTGDPAWFSCPQAQQDCAPSGNRRDVFTLNPSNHDTDNTSTTAKATQMDPTSPPRISSLSQIRTDAAVSVVTAGPSLGVWPTSNGTPAINSSIRAPSVPSPKGQPSGSLFSGRAATTELPRGVLSLYIAYHFVMRML